MVPDTCPFYLGFRAQLSPGWTWLCPHLHPPLGIQLGPGGVMEHLRYPEGSVSLDLHTQAMTNTACQDLTRVPGKKEGC